MRGHSRVLIRLINNTIKPPITGCELGCWRGHNTAALLQAFPNLNLTAVDPWEDGGDFSTMPERLEQILRAKQEFSEVTAFAANRLNVLRITSEAAAPQVADGSLDFVFVDACHTYEHVINDLRLWAPKVRVDGLICGHDYDGRGDRIGWFGVKPAVDELAREWGFTVGVVSHAVWWYKRQEA